MTEEEPGKGTEEHIGRSVINQACVALWQLSACAEKERALSNVEATMWP